jgi:unsaturated rhamnogalacturonyl hydrolase
MVLTTRLLIVLGLVLVTVGGPGIGSAASTTLPSPSTVLSVMNRVADFAQDRYTPNTNAFWDDGVYHIGLMAYYNVSHDPNTLMYVDRFGDFNQWLLDRGGSGNRHNRLAAGQAWIDSYRVQPEILKVNDTLTEVAAQTVASLSTITAGAYFTVDSQFMALPTFAMIWSLFPQPAYLDRMQDLFQYTKTTLGLYDMAAHLYYRDANYRPERTPNGKKIFWSRGNGWALGAMARVLQHLPSTHPDWPVYLATFRELAAAIRAVQRADGFWNMNLADPVQFAGPETSGTALFVYGMAWGINQGLLSATTYRPTVAKGWNALVSAVHSTGQLGFVQGVGKEPVPVSQVTSNSSADFGVGAFLLAGSEVYRLAGSTPPPPPPPPPPTGMLYEAEALPVTVSGGDGQVDVAHASASAGQYSKGNLNSIGDLIEYAPVISTPGTYRVTVRFAKGPGLGNWQFFSAGANVGSAQVGYSATFGFTEVDLGSVTYTTSGKKVFRFTVTGKASASSGFATAIDAVRLTQ